MPSQVYNPTNKTLVTEIKSFAVDAVRKTAVMRNTISTKTDATSVLNNMDMIVDKTGIEVTGSKQYLLLSSIEELEIHLTQTRYEEHIPIVPTTGTILVQDFVVGTPLRIMVSDADRVDLTSIEVLVVNTDSNQQISLVLYSEEGSTVFGAELPTVFSVWDEIETDQQLYVLPEDTIRIEYVDPLTEDQEIETVVSTVTALTVPSHTAILKVNTDLVPGEPLHIQVYDIDSFNIGDTSLEATVINQRTNETEILALQQTSIDGLYEYFLDTYNTNDAGVDQDGEINVVVLDTLEFEYIDPNNEEGFIQTVTTSFIVGYPQYETATINAGATQAGTPIEIELIDSDPTGPVVVTVINQGTGEVETLTLYETSPLSGKFVSTLNTLIGEGTWYKGSDNDGILHVKPGDIILINHTDSIAANGDPMFVSAQLTILEPDEEILSPEPEITEVVETVKFKTRMFLLDGDNPDIKLLVKVPETSEHPTIRCNVVTI